MKILFSIVLVNLFLLANAQNTSKPKIEFRGVWVATVVNIDWPKKPEDDFAKKQVDFIEILDLYKKMNLNAVIVQIRTAGDAFYPSQLVPISKYLTGKEGQNPENNFDFLNWMISQTHVRGMEFHAWLNPYRATFDLNTEILSPTNNFFTHQDWMIKYGTRYYYNPGLPEVQNHLVSVIDEIVKNYQIDAIHFDDYFYPYKIEKEFFNDTLAYKKYGIKNQKLDDWRRANVDSLMKKVHFAIKKIKPKVQFGISPFGVWRNKSVDSLGSDSQAGQTNYDDLYADPKVWMKNKWIDYLAPQLYWSLDNKRASHRKLINWWNENCENVNLFIGNGTYKIRLDKDKAWKNKHEIPNQIELARNVKNVKGNIFFSAISLQNKHKDVVELISNLYSEPALPPSAPNNDCSKPETPKLKQIYRLEKQIVFEFENSFSTNFEFVILKKHSSQNDKSDIKKQVASVYDSNKILSVDEDSLQPDFQYEFTFFNQNAKESEPFSITFDEITAQTISKK